MVWGSRSGCRLKASVGPALRTLLTASILLRESVHLTPHMNEKTLLRFL